MIIFGTIIFILLVVLLVVSFLFYISPILLGLIIIISGNMICRIKLEKTPSTFWNILGFLATICSTGMLWKDIRDDAINYGPTPFVILGLFALVSLVLFAILMNNKEKNEAPFSSSWDSDEETLNNASYTIEDEQASYTSPRLAQICQNLSVDTDAFLEYGITFKCNLIEEFDILQLNYELFNTKQFINIYGKDAELGIKANIYDAFGHLLYIEANWLDYNQLRQGYVADYFYFTGENMHKANSMTIYAVILGDDDDDEEI